MTFMNLLKLLLLLLCSATLQPLMAQEDSSSDASEVFQIVDEMPTFPGCEEISNKSKREQCTQQKMLQFIYNNLRYPPQASANGTDGEAKIKLRKLR